MKPLESALWVMPLVLVLVSTCESDSGSDLVEPPLESPTDDGRWVRIHATEPDTVPFLFSPLVAVQGEGFDGIRSVVLVYDDGIRFGRIEDLTSTKVVFRIPDSSPRWSTASLIVSETPERARPEPFHQSDTVLQAIAFVGPVPEDTLIYEFRYPSLDGGRIVRWDMSDFPLKVWISPEIPERVHESIWVGTAAWDGLIAPGIPGFVMVDSSEGADIRWTTTSLQCGTSWGEEEDRLTVQVICPLETHAIIPLDIMTNVAVHETGHALGLHHHSHRRSDIMGPSLDFLDQGFSEADIRTLRALYSMPVSNPPFP